MTSNSKSSHVVVAVPCLLVGGTEVHTQMLARALIGGGYRVTICAYYEHDPIMVDACEAEGARVRLLSLSRDAASKNLGRGTQLARKWATLLRSERPDFVHVQYMTPSLVPLLVARCFCRRVLATVHVPGHHYGKRLWRHRLVATRLCDAFLCNSQVVERSFFGGSSLFGEDGVHVGQRHFTIPNCVDLRELDEVLRLTDIRSLREELGLRDGKVVGMVARLTAEKGAHVLLSAMEKVVRDDPAVALLVVGDGREKPSLLAQADRLGIADRIRWVGRVDRRAALRHMALMDVVAVPSSWEGFGLTAAEAMACGIPVVATDVDGLREVISSPDTGLLVPRADSSALADGINRLLRDRELRRLLGQAGRKRVEQHFSFGGFASRHLRLYRALSARGRWATAECSDAMCPTDAGRSPIYPSRGE